MFCFLAGSIGTAPSEAADGQDRAQLMAALERMIVHAIPRLSDYSPWPTWSPKDRTAADNLAFRFINPQRAPSQFSEPGEVGLM